MCSLCKILLKIQIHVRSLKVKAVFVLLEKCLWNTAISRKVVAKTVHATIPKGNVGNDQYVAVKPTFVAFL